VVAGVPAAHRAAIAVPADVRAAVATAAPAAATGKPQ